jgi:hypothetical protein
MPSQQAVTCTRLASQSFALGSVNAVVVRPASAGHGDQCVIASSAGLLLYAPPSLIQLLPDPMTAVAYSPSSQLIASGNSLKLTLINQSNLVVRWDWVTNLDTQVGGVYDGPITSLAFDVSGNLYVGTTVCLNVLFTNGTVTRIDGVGGLPYNMTTSVSVESGTQVVWVGTVQGACRWDIKTNTWRYFYGPR